MKRLRIGRDCGTTTAWQEGVERVIAKIWIIQAWRSVLMIEGKTSAASTRAFRDKCMSDMASSVIWWRAG